jgi:hypothetical protein
MAVVKLSIPPQPEHVRTARLVAGAAARRCGVDEGVLDEVRLAVGEACARAVNRQAAIAGTAQVRVELEDGDDTFAVRVHDPSPNEQGEIDDGLALAVISGLVPDSSVAPGAGGTVISMLWPVAALRTFDPA